MADQPYSFLGSLQIPDAYHPRADDHKCGVTLLALQWAVTGSHCARNPFNALTGTPRGWTVRFGSLDQGAGGEVAPVDKFYRLVPDQPGMGGRDVALLHLVAPVKAKPTRLASVTPTAGTPVRIVGWGSTCSDAEAGKKGRECYPDRLRQADTVVTPLSECRGRPGHLCVGVRNGGIEAANTDSGGPALVKENGQWLVAGTAESGSNSPNQTLYADVVKQAEWIKGIMSGARVPADDPVPDIDVSGSASLDFCSGSVVRAPASKVTDAALVLTNGHCVDGDRPTPGAALVDQPADRKVALQDRGGWVQTVAHADRLVYATMTGTDAAVYRMDKTYGQLAAAGVKILDLTSTPMRAGDKIRLLTADPRHTSSCAVAAVVPHLREGGWQQDDSVRYNTCTSTHGDSGAALLSEDGTTVVGVNNTSNDDGQRCTENNPCEVDANGAVTAVKGRSYGQQVHKLAACLAERSTIDLSRPGCTLTHTDKPTA
ncbi:trypsin-like serine protease [Amycolatopsis sp. cmx-11-12]|uniref:trypsin-like serine protease n=1 Tax=Amycolatopsis sp. cmx-11-12 TaxID=2785795 RepID=UPI0039186451